MSYLIKLGVDLIKFKWIYKLRLDWYEKLNRDFTRLILWFYFNFKKIILF